MIPMVRLCAFLVSCRNTRLGIGRVELAMARTAVFKR